jgi:hypothetical protein
MRKSHKQKNKIKFAFSVLFFALSLFIFACGKTTDQKESTPLVTQEKEVVLGDGESHEDNSPVEKKVTEGENEEKSAESVKEEDIEAAGSLEKNVEPIPAKIEEPKIPKIFFEEKVHKFGDIDQGDTIVHSYMFINTGSAPLYITDVDLSCGCTMSDYPKTAIKPRQAGYIELLFNSTHKEGSQRQYAIVSSNTSPGKDTLLLAGVVYRKMEDVEE